MDKAKDDEKHAISSYNTSWEEWRTEQVQTITHILATVFKVEDEAREMQSPSRLLRRSSMSTPEAEAEIRKKLTQIRQQISEYEEMLKLGLKRIDNALQTMDPPSSTPSVVTPLKPAKSFFFFHTLLKKLRNIFHTRF